MIRRFPLAPGVGIEMVARGRAARHVTAEYDDGRSVTSAVDVLRLSLGLRDGASGEDGEPTLALWGGHRVARWRARIWIDPVATHATCAVQVAGPLGLTLVQSMVVEPLLSLVTPSAGRVLLPGALLGATDGPVLVLGASGAGKSTLALRALAAGRLVAADDQVLLGAHGGCIGLPRRLRVYGDLPEVVPEAHKRLGPVSRALVAAVALISRASGGRVSPPVLVRPAEIAPAVAVPGRELKPVRAVILAGGVPRTRLGGEALVALSRELLAEQRERLCAAGLVVPPVTLEAEAAILAAGLAHLDVERIDPRAGGNPFAALERAAG